MQASKPKTIFALPGSLRSGSSNHHVLNFLKKLAPAGVNFFIYDNLAKIPPFDPGDDHERPPDAIDELRCLAAYADAIIICSPEYAYGVPGQLKNALDWTVSSASLSGKPAALITASTGGETAHAAMIKILGALNADLLPDATLLISFIRTKMDANGNITDEETAGKLSALLKSLLKAIS